MSSPSDHLWVAVLAIAMVALPLVLLTAGVLLMAVVTSLSPTDARRKHNRRIMRDLTEYARVLRGS